MNSRDLPSIVDATLPASYEQAKTALATCNRVDECKSWADKAKALASYAKQADDDTLHKLATRISARAIRRCGELLKEFQSPGGRPLKTSVGADTSFSQRDAARDAGISKRQEVTAVRVANVPADAFELAIESDQPATITQLADIGKQTQTAPPGFKAATHAISTVKDFATFCKANAPEFVADGVYAYETANVRANVDTIHTWLITFTAHLQTED